MTAAPDSIKRALVTGASGSLGVAIARKLAAQGLFVWLHANRSAPIVQEAAETIRAAGGEADVVAFDLRDSAAVAAALERVLDAGPIQVLVNNAGITADAPMAGMSEDQWSRVLDTNMGGFFRVTQPLLLPMIRCRWGRIVNIGSVAGVLGNRGQVNYSASKAGLIGASRSLALELASRGVTVNVVAPGIIDSELARHAFDDRKVAQLVPIGRMGQPAEVADLVAFLCSDSAGYITGQVIGINGGMG